MTLVAMTSTMTSEIHEVHAPITSTKRSMPARAPPVDAASWPAASGTADLAVIDRFAVTRPAVVLRLERHIGGVYLLRHGVLGDRLLEHLDGRRAQALDHVVRQRPRDHALFLDQILHRFGIGALAPCFADHVARRTCILHHRL